VLNPIVLFYLSQSLRHHRKLAGMLPDCVLRRLWILQWALLAVDNEHEEWFRTSTRGKDAVSASWSLPKLAMFFITPYPLIKHLMLSKNLGLARCLNTAE